MWSLKFFKLPLLLTISITNELGRDFAINNLCAKLRDVGYYEQWAGCQQTRAVLHHTSKMTSTCIKGNLNNIDCWVPTLTKISPHRPCNNSKGQTRLNVRPISYRTLIVLASRTSRRLQNVLL